MKKRVTFIGSLVFGMSLFVMGMTVPAMAHDGTVGTETNPIVFYDASPYNSLHQDQDPWKGFFMLWTQNSTGTDWSGFNFTVSGSNAVFIDTALWDTANPSNPCSSWAFDGSCDPISSKGVSSWNISGDQKSMSVSLNSDWTAGQSGWIRVYTDNTASPQGNFTVSISPVLVPEPVSSTLFIVGAATLGFRRFRKRNAA